jgi:hypothetical protein
MSDRSEPLFDSVWGWWRVLTRSYRCATCNADVRGGEHHEHGCPLPDYRGERCAERQCNRTGRCQR